MKKILLLVMAAACGLLANCKSTVAMKSSELAVITGGPESTTKRIRLSVRVDSPGEAPLVVPEMIALVGRDFTVEDIREFVYPSTYKTATVSGTSVSPATPTNFNTVNTGLTMILKAEPKGRLIVLSGKVDVVKFDHFIEMGGELGRPIADERGKVLSENRVEMPAIRTFTTPVYIAAKPGTPVSFEIDHPKKGTRVTITAAALK